MAKLKIMSIELAAPKSRREEVLSYLQRKGAVELSSPEENSFFSLRNAPGDGAEIQRRAAEVAAAAEILGKACPEKKPLTAMLEPRKELSGGEYALMAGQLGETLEKCEKIISLDKRKAELRADTVRYRALAAAYEPWKSCPVPLKAGFTEKTAYVPGSFRRGISREEILSRLAEKLPENDCVEIKTLYSDKEITCIMFYSLREDCAAVEDVLRGLGFVRAPETEKPPAAELEELEKKLADARGELAACGSELEKAARDREKIKFAADFLSAGESMSEAEKKLSESSRVFFLKGYIAERDAKRVASYAEKHFDAAVEIRQPSRDEDVPVLLSNNFFASPLENITGMYSMPGKTDPDPTGIMAFFYYFFFGMMLSDAGYGLMMVLATGGVLLFKRNLERKMKNTLVMYLFCGLSTVFWGAMYGSWFGDMINVVRREFLGLPEVRLYIWMEPVEQLMELIVYCFLFGLVHLFVGVAVKAVSDLKNGDRFGAFCDSVPTYLTILGIAPIFFGLFSDKVPDAVRSAGMPVFIVGLALVVLTAGRSSKSLPGKLGGGLYEVYNLLGGYLGDVLSYARLLALGLSTGVIANVINMLGTLPGNKTAKLLMFIAVSVIGHTANFGINVIGAYVHTIRLQYVEFFGKFYEGGGRAFVPFEAQTKYYKLREEN